MIKSLRGMQFMPEYNSEGLKMDGRELRFIIVKMGS